MACVNSAGLLPLSLVQAIIYFDDTLLTMAMAALGLIGHYSTFQKAGFKLLLLGLVIFIWLTIGGGLVNLLINYVL